MDTQTQHTPGPWIVGTDPSRDARPGRVHILFQKPGQPMNRVAVCDYEYDAALVAAAPELYEALNSIAENTCCDTCQEAALVARAALADVVEAARYHLYRAETHEESGLNAALMRLQDLDP